MHFSTLKSAVWLLPLALPYSIIAATMVEQVAQVPAGWSVMGAPKDDTMMTLQIALTQQNLDKLEYHLMDVSTPGSANYGKHWEREDVENFFKPAPGSENAVTSWLADEGVQHVTSDGQWVTFATSVSNANRMLGAKFMNYGSNGLQKLRTTQYSVPDELAEHVDLIHPTTYFGKFRANVPTPAKVQEEPPTKRDTELSAICTQSITPQCLKQLYHVNGYKPNATSGSRIGFGSFLNQSAIYSDLAQYEKTFGIPSQNFTVELIQGGVNNQTTDQITEADLDVQNIIGVSHPLPVTEFITDENEPYLHYYTYLLSKSNAELPQVISNSYGEDEQTVPIKYAMKVCNMIGQIGMRGITVFESSGDTGVGAPCQSNDGKKTPMFMPQFPGSCPYITGVGGTQSVSPEIAWVASSGGFSNYFARPSFQNASVSTYLSKHISKKTYNYYTAYTNFSGRGFPDVSAHSLTPDFAIVYAGKISKSGGTSAAAPVWAALVGMLNDARLQAGKPALGYLNPFLYSEGYKSLIDITGGQSVGCNGVNGQTGAPIPGGTIIPYATWNATNGWDPVTGLGAPNFTKLMAAVLAM